ncbi:site-specific integrase [Alteromonas mediterranea]|uniref:site-specific integrase n=1 Tax=Alteromonas mediterranea TaxID=314275 RepID=UPI0012F8668F|nr:site-specific integrase [Alteromonas mediterranea]QGX61453.1 tyrosine-type recombinase/integrase [Alteromonas mediterranea]
MARIQKRQKKDGSYSYTVTIRKGQYKHRPQVKTFSKKTVALAWARKIENEIEAGTYLDSKVASNYTVNELIDRYAKEILIHKSQNTQDITNIRLNILRNDFRYVTLNRLDKQFVYGVFTKMLTRTTKQTEDKPEHLRKTWSPAYVAKFIQDLTSILRVAINLWNIPLPHGNVAIEAKKLMQENQLLNGADLHKDTRLINDQYERIKSFRNDTQSLFKYFALFAIETGMRRQEIVSMKKDNIDWKNSFYKLEEHKSDNRRTRFRKGRDVPLTKRALAILRLVIYSQKSNLETVWPWTGKYAGSTAYRGVKRIFKKLGMQDVTVHDLRHEFGSYHIDRGMDMRLVGAAMGHQSLNSTKRYTHPDAKKIASLFDYKR